jgi:hypothetical protein
VLHIPFLLEVLGYKTNGLEAALYSELKLLINAKYHWELVYDSQFRN